MMSSLRGLAWTVLIAILHCPSSILASATSTPPANVEFVPVPQAVTLCRHPTLPVLYVGCYGFPEQRNLITFQLGQDGSIATNTMKVCDDYFSVDGRKPENIYRIVPRPSVLTKPHVLVLGCWADNYAIFLANSNNNQHAVIALDDQGQPARLLKAFRANTTGEMLIAARAEQTTRRLYIANYVYFGWCELGEDGLPPTREFVPMPVPINQWYWEYVPSWQRFFTMPPAASLTILRLAADNRTAEFIQTIPTMPGSPGSGNLTVSESLQKIYVAGSEPGRELCVYSLSRDGRLIGVPRTFGIGPAYRIRVDSKAKKLYAIALDWMKVYTLDKDGFPTGQSSLHSLSCGTVHDALVDENTGKIYLACTAPLAARP